MSCSYLFCNSKKESPSKLSHHKFPSDAKLLQKWVDAMGLENFVPRASNKLCSAHFEPSMFWGGLQRSRLREDAVPTLFEAPFKRAKLSLQGEHGGPGQREERPFAHLWLPQPALQMQGSTATGASGATAAIADSGATQERESPEPEDLETQVDAATALKMHSYSYSLKCSGRHHWRPLVAPKAKPGAPGHHQQPFLDVESVPSPGQGDTAGMDSPEASFSSYSIDVATASPPESVEATEHPQGDEDIDILVDILEVSPSSPYTSDVADASSDGSVARESSDRSREDTPEREFLREEVRRYAAIASASRRKIKALQGSERRLRRKVAELKAIITELELQRCHDGDV